MRKIDDMHKVILLFVVISSLFLVSESAQAQGYSTKPYSAIELYVGLGTTHYFGELGGESGTVRGLGGVIDNLGIDIEQSRYGGVVGFRYILNKTFAFTAHLSPMLLAGSDINSRNAERAYTFYSYVVEGAVSGEMFIANRLTGAAPYLMMGIGGLAYNSKASWIAPSKWSGLTFGSDMLMGIGVRFPLNHKYTQSVEAGFRYAFQDDIDRIGNGMIGDTFFVLNYKINMDLDKVFVYDHRGRINR